MKAPSWSALLTLAIVLAGCAASARETTIKTSLIAVQAADGAFVAYDKTHQEEIVAHATSLEDGKAKLAAYRAKQDTVRKAFVVAYTAIGVAATVNDDHSLAGMQLALQQVLTAVAALTSGAVAELTGGKP